MERKAYGILLAVALLTTALAGCVLPGQEPDDDTGETAVTRQVVIDLTGVDERAGPEALLEALQASFEYTHEGNSVSPADVEVSYDDPAGEAATATLDRWTSADTIEDGDRVTIDEVFPTSSITLTHEGTELAAREPLEIPWLTVDGAPLPLSLQPGGVAAYEQSSSLGFEASLANLDISGFDSEYEEGEAVIEELNHALNVPVTNTFRVEAASTADTVDLTLESDGEPTMNSNLVGVSENESIDAGIDASANWLANFQTTFFLDAAKQLDRIGAEGSITVDGEVTIWDPEHPKEENWTPPELDEHPWFEDELPYTEEQVGSSTDGPTDGGGPPPEAVDMLEKVWGMDIAIGDTFRYKSTAPATDGSEVTIEAVTQILAREDKAVPGGPTIDSYRVHQQVDVTSPDTDAACRTDQSHQNDYWISADSYLPVFMDTSERHVLGPDTILACLELAEELGMPADEQQDIEKARQALEDADFQVVIEGSSTTKLLEHEHGIAIPPVLLLLSGASSALMGSTFMQGFAQGFMGGMGFDEPTQPPGYEPYDPDEDGF